MFILRQVSEHREKNAVLGKKYEFVGFVSHEKEFRIAYNFSFGEEPPESYGDAPGPKVFAFVSANGVYIPLYSDDNNYIMCSDGKTFEKINQH